MIAIITSSVANSDPLPAIIENKKVVVKGNNAITLYNRGYYGIPAKNSVILTGFEALHLFELGRISISINSQKMNEQDLIDYFSSFYDTFVLRYLVYKDLRNRGYVVNQGEGSSFFFRLYERNAVPKKDGAKYYVIPLKEGSSIVLKELEELIEIAKLSEKLLVFGMVDAVGDVSYLKVTQLSPDRNQRNQHNTDPRTWDWNRQWDEFYGNA